MRNFDRPILHYIDNVRRDIRREARGAVPDPYISPGGTYKPTKVSRSLPTVSLNEEEESAAALELLDSLLEFIDFQTALIEDVLPASKSDNENHGKLGDRGSEQELLRSAQKFLALALISKVNGRHNMLDWYIQFWKGLQNNPGYETERGWDILNNFGMKATWEEISVMTWVQSL